MGRPDLQVVWFKRDLRVHDHAALTAAVDTGSPVLPLYVIEPSLLALRDRPFDPLWAGGEVERALAPVDGSQDALLWVAGLQDQFLTGSRARSARCQAAYDAAVETLNGLAARMSGRGRITVVVL